MVELRVVYTCEARGHRFDSRCSHKFKIVRMIIPTWLINQPDGTLSRMYVQKYIRVKLVAVSVNSEA